MFFVPYWLPPVKPPIVPISLTWSLCSRYRELVESTRTVCLCSFTELLPSAAGAEMWVCWDSGRRCCTARCCTSSPGRVVLFAIICCLLSFSGVQAHFLELVLACTGDHLLAPLFSEDCCTGRQKCLFPMLSNWKSFIIYLLAKGMGELDSNAIYPVI